MLFAIAIILAYFKADLLRLKTHPPPF